MPEDLVWVSVRHVISHPSDGTGHGYFYEERVTTWRAADMDAAIALAEAEVVDHLLEGMADTGLYQAYLLCDDPGSMVSGTETFSLIRASDLEPSDYLDRFFDTGDEYQGTAS